jgi:hypothetical protein
MPVGEGPETDRDWVRVPWLDSDKLTDEQLRAIDEFRKKRLLAP